MKCKSPKSPKEIWRQMRGEYSYNWLRQKLDELYCLEFLEKRKGGSGKGNAVYYTTESQEDLEWAKNHLSG